MRREMALDFRYWKYLLFILDRILDCRFGMTLFGRARLAAWAARRCRPGCESCYQGTRTVGICGRPRFGGLLSGCLEGSKGRKCVKHRGLDCVGWLAGWNVYLMLFEGRSRRLFLILRSFRLLPNCRTCCCACPNCFREPETSWLLKIRISPLLRLRSCRPEIFSNPCARSPTRNWRHPCWDRRRISNLQNTFTQYATN